MARPSSPAALWSQYLAARVAEMGLAIAGPRPALRLAGVLGRIMFRWDHSHRQRTLANLEIAYPEHSAAQRRHLAARSFEHFIRLLVESCYCPRLFHEASWSWHNRLGSFGNALKLLNSGKPAIVLTGHLGNWEVLGSTMALLGYPIHAVARPIDHPLINDWLLGIRQRRGLKILAKKHAADDMVSILRAGGVLAFLADQSAGSRGMFVPFFGRLASAHKSIALLALTQNVPIIVGYARRIDRDFGFELGVADVIEPHDWADRRDPVYYVTARHVRAIERIVRRWPEQYLWMHRRWRRRPAWERRGKPMPHRLRRNLEELPWLEAPTLKRLVSPQAAEWAAN